jgi:outer membrane protein assembly factor BamB
VHYKNFLVAALLLGARASSAQPVDVTTYHYDNARLGGNVRESQLTPAAVSGGRFGKLWDNPLDGYVHGSPLLVTAVPIAGTRHDVVYAVTDANRAYALDAANGRVLWKSAPLAPPLTAGQFNGSWNSSERHGVLSTPVIDRERETLYTCAPRAQGLRQFYEVHALDLRTGKPRPGWPIALSGRYKGAVFTPGQIMQRGALTLSRGRLYIPFGGRGDIPPWRGWVLALDTRKPSAAPSAFCTSPVTDGAGVWSAGGVSVDQQGRVYLVTGNGDYDIPEGGDNFGQSVLRLTPDLRFTRKRTDYFTPANYRFLDEQDEDLGGATCLILPPLSGVSSVRLLFTGGKDGCGYLLARETLGGLGGQLQRTRLFCDENATYHEGIRATAAYFQTTRGEHLLFVPGDNPGPDNNLGIVALRLIARAGKPTFEKVWTLAKTISRPTGPIVTSNGGRNGIVWVVESADDDAPTFLHAYDAETGRALYTSGDGADRLVGGRKFTGPIAANGRVFVGARGVFCYGVRP